MNNKPKAESISKSHVNAARHAVNKLRDEEYDRLKSPVKTVIDNLIAELSACTDTDALSSLANTKFKFINDEFIQREYGISAKFKALDMLKAYTSSIYTQLGILKQMESPER